VRDRVVANGHSGESKEYVDNIQKKEKRKKKA
jgi:hypothetical protein